MADPFGSAAGVLAGVAVGGAATVALQPAFEIPRQDAWARNANRILDVDLLARLVAQGGIDLSSAEDEAKRDGFGPDKLDALVYMAQTVPGFAEALDLWRRGLIGDDLMSHTLVKAGLDQRYTGPLLQLKEAALVGLGDIATAIVRGALPSPSYMPVSPPTSGLSVPRFPQVPLDPEALAAKLGFDPEMLQLMVARSGLSLAPIFAANAFFREIINDNDFLLAIAEGDLRTEWAEVLKEAAREIPTVGQMMEHALRGFEDVASAQTNAKRHGTVAADSQLIYDNMGRAPNVHAITTGLARGATYPGDYGMVPSPYKEAIQRSDIRPEFADIVYHDRYTYPSAFVLRSLAQAGDLGGQAAVEQVLLEIGWKPSFASQVSTAWTGGAKAADTHVAKAQTQLWTATHKSYVNGEVSSATATTSLEAAGVSAAAVPAVLQVWDAERDLIRKSLSAAQIKKAWVNQVDDPALGRPWTEAEAVARLQELGYSADDAALLLSE